jgi:putative cell wall-binding protein
VRRIGVRAALVCSAAALLAGIAIAGTAWSYSADDSTFYDGAADLSAFDATSTVGIAVDPLGGIRLATDGATSTTVWTSAADFHGTGAGPVVGLPTLSVVGTGTGPEGSLRLSPSDPAITPDATPAIVPSFDASADAGDSYEVHGPAVVKVSASDFRMYYTGVAPDGYVQRVFEATSSDGFTFRKAKGVLTGGAVLDVGGAGAFDAHGLVRPTVVYDASSTPAFRMWYGSLSETSGALGYATSADGHAWTKHVDASGTPRPVLVPGVPGTADGYSVGEPSASYDPSAKVFRLWYAAQPSPDVAGRQVGYATSTNTSADEFGGVWRKGGIVGLTGSIGNWAGGWFSPGAWYDPLRTPVHWMLFAGKKSAGQPYKLMSANSPDGLSWQYGNVILSNGTAGSWNANNVYWASVVREPTSTPAYRIYYTGNGGSGDWARNAIGYGTWSGTGGGTDLGRILDRSNPPVRFDTNQVAGAAVIRTSDATSPWTMLYGGRAASDLVWRIGYATSPDGRSWTKRDGTADAVRKSVLPLGAGGSFDASGTSAPSVAALDASATGYAMWYEGTSASGVSAIGLATATAGALQSWSRYGQVLAPSGGGFDAFGVSHPSVVTSGTDWRMYYAGFDGGRWRIGVATSTADARTWTRGILPVVSLDSTGGLDTGGAYDPVVVIDRSAQPSFRMWYTAEDADGVRRLAYATSADGYGWTKRGLALAPSEAAYSFDEVGVRAAGAVKDPVSGTWRVFFDGVDRGNRGDSAGSPHVDWRRIGYASGSSSGYDSRGSAAYEVDPMGTPAPGYQYEFRSFSWDSSEPSGTGAQYEISYFPAYTLPGGAPVQLWSRWVPIGTTSAPRLPLTTQKVRWRVAFSREASVTSFTPDLAAFRATWAPVHFTFSGRALSIPITAASGKYIETWKALDVDVTGASATTTATVTVVAEDGQVMVGPIALSNGTNHVDLSALTAGLPSLRVRFDLAGDGLGTPYINDWKVSYSTTSRAPVLDLRTVNSSGTVLVSWTDPSYDGMTRTRLLRRFDTFSTSATDTSATVLYDATATPGAARVATDLVSPNGRVCYYTAYTTDGAGWSPPSFVIGVPQAPPWGLTAVPHSGSIGLNWSLPPVGGAWAGTMAVRKTAAPLNGPWDPAAQTVGKDVPGRTLDDTTAVGGVYYYGVFGDYKVTVSERDYHAYSSLATAAPVRFLSVENIEGPNRFATAIAAVRKAFPNGASTVVIAWGRNFPDALGASALCGAYNAPLLLTETAALPTSVRAEITRLGATHAVIIGSAGVVSKAVENDLGKLVGGATRVERIAGSERYDTAARVARATMQVLGASSADDVFLAVGDNFPDALAASPAAYAKRWPIVLTPRTSLPTQARSALTALAPKRVHILGGIGAVPLLVEKQLRDAYPSLVVDRWKGENRYATAVDIANRSGLSWGGIGIATGQNFPDALAGGVMQGKLGGVVLLTPTASLSLDTASAITAHRPEIGVVRYLGSTSAVSTAVRNRVMQILTQ